MDCHSLQKLPENIDRLVYMPTPATRNMAGYEAIFIRGWKNLWFALKQAPRRTILVSSTAVYGESEGGFVDEDTSPEPTGYNGKVLLKMERLARGHTENLVVVRISGIYGPGRERLIERAASKDVAIQKKPPYFTNRIHRDDAAAALQHLLMIDKPKDLYIASDDQPAPIYDVVNWLAKEQGANAPAELVVEHADCGKRVGNQRLRDSGFNLHYPDYRAGYGAVLKKTTPSSFRP